MLEILLESSLVNFTLITFLNPLYVNLVILRNFYVLESWLPDFETFGKMSRNFLSSLVAEIGITIFEFVKMLGKIKGVDNNLL